MKTELGEMRVIDAHADFFSQPFFLQLVQALRPELPSDDPHRALAARLGWELPTADHAALGRRWVQEMDKHGLERMALIASLPGDEDSILAAACAPPQRIIGYSMLDPTQPDAGVAAGCLRFSGAGPQGAGGHDPAGAADLRREPGPGAETVKRRNSLSTDSADCADSSEGQRPDPAKGRVVPSEPGGAGGGRRCRRGSAPGGIGQAISIRRSPSWTWTG